MLSCSVLARCPQLCQLNLWRSNYAKSFGGLIPMLWGATFPELRGSPSVQIMTPPWVTILTRAES